MNVLAPDFCHKAVAASQCTCRPCSLSQVFPPSCVQGQLTDAEKEEIVRALVAADPSLANAGWTGKHAVRAEAAQLWAAQAHRRHWAAHALTCSLGSALVFMRAGTREQRAVPASMLATTAPHTVLALCNCCAGVGHFFRCACGSVYHIGDCGGAEEVSGWQALQGMEAAGAARVTLCCTPATVHSMRCLSSAPLLHQVGTCPACGRHIGGRNHRTVETSQAADDFFRIAQRVAQRG